MILNEFVSLPTVDTAEIAFASNQTGYAIFSSISASYTQSTDNLQNVTDRGNTTTNPITVGGLTASGLIYPDTDGTDGQVLTTDGAGNLTFDTIEDIYVTVKNVSGVELAKGTPVHATSSNAAGNATPVIAASASDSTTMPATFVLNETIADEAEGQALLSGFIQGVNTLGFTVGDVVYVGENGGFTNIKPQSSDNLIQNLGIVTKIHETNGSGWIYGSGRSNDVPNLPTGKIWVGSDTYTLTSSIVTLDEPNSRATIDGDLTVVGTGSFGTLHTIYETSSIIYSSGSTKFGDSEDDIHQYTGSVYITGSLEVSGSLTVKGPLILQDVPSYDDPNFDNLPNGSVYKFGSYLLVKQPE